MGNPKAFLTIPRQEAGYRAIEERVHDFAEVEQTLNATDRKLQASRCMDCGVPFCHWACPLGNKQPEFNDALSRGRWHVAYDILSKTNDFPEFTGRICPAGCEKACVLKLSCGEPTTIRENECSIIEKAFREGHVVPFEVEKNGKSVAVIGSGPAGLAAANQLCAKGYDVTVFDRREAAGGLLRFGIPNFKLNKHIIDRRIDIMERSGVRFVYGVDVNLERLAEDGVLTLPEQLAADGVASSYDAYVVATGTPTARDLNIPGRELQGVHFALDILSQQNRILAGQTFSREELVTAKGKHVLVIGGGDTGSDCIGTANRQGALSVTQIEIMPKPPVGEDPQNPWPAFPRVFKTTSSHEEGCERRWLLNSLRFVPGKDGKHVSGVEVETIEWLPNPDGGRPILHGTGKKEVIKAELVLLAMGFLKPEQPKFGENVFLAGDAATGASLVVKCIASGRAAAQQVDGYLRQKFF